MKFFDRWKAIITDPMNNFTKLPKKNVIKESCIYFLKIQAIAMALMYVFMLLLLPLRLLPMVIGEQFLSVIAGIGMILLIPLALIFYVIILLFSLGMLFVSAGLIQIFIKMFGGKKGYATTFQALAYASSPYVLMFIPMVNWLATLYGLVLQVIGIHKLQKISVGKSILAFILPGVIIAILLFILVGVGILMVVF
jgi:hypothetical protein